MKDMYLENKNILFISTETFGIEKNIKEKLEGLGAKVDYYNERPSNTILVKGLIRLKSRYVQKIINKYYNSILEEIINKEYDYLFVIKGEAIPVFFLKSFIKNHPQTDRIFYTWDSILNNNNAIKLLDFFNNKSTFDDKDAIKYNMNLRPLFYFDDFRQFESSNISQYKYELLHIGTAHSDRYILTNKITNWCKNKGLETYSFFFLQSRIVYFFYKFFDNSFKSFDYKKISFKSLSTSDIIDFYKKSRVILDINHPDQVGLTMRTFEAIGANKKIITTNEQIKNYNFYNPINILIINRNSIQLNEEFFKTPYQKIEKDIYYNLSLDGWVKEIFNINKNNDWLIKDH